MEAGLMKVVHCLIEVGLMTVISAYIGLLLYNWSAGERCPGGYVRIPRVDVWIDGGWICLL